MATGVQTEDKLTHRKNVQNFVLILRAYKTLIQKFREAENGFPKAFLLTSSTDA